MNVEHEVQLLVEEIQRLGSKSEFKFEESDSFSTINNQSFSDNDGLVSVKFGVLFNDDRCANIFEALVGTLKAAKRKKLISFQGELLLQGVHDDVDITLLQE